MSRVIIVDDDAADGEEIARALWQIQLAPVFFQYPAKPADKDKLEGVRLAILDMDLLGVGSATDVKTKMAALVGYLEVILNAENGPFVVIAWTGHPEYVEEFERYVYQLNELPKPVAVVTLQKETFKKDGKYDGAALLEALKPHLKNYSALLFLQAWEQESFLAASRVVDALSRFGGTDAKTLKEWIALWDVALRKIIYAVARAAAGTENVNTSDQVLSAFASALAPLHADRAEMGFPALIKGLSEYAANLTDGTATTGVDAEMMAKINTMLHCSWDDLDRFYAGNVYADAPGLTMKRDLLDATFLKEIKDAQPEQRAARQKEHSDLLNLCIPIVIECSAICDHVQGNVQVARLVPGLLVPQSESDKNKTRFRLEGDARWKLGPLEFKTTDNVVQRFYLVVNFLYVNGVDAQRLKRLPAMFRLRYEAFVDLQAGLARHATRTGTLLLRIGD